MRRSNVPVSGEHRLKDAAHTILAAGGDTSPAEDTTPSGDPQTPHHMIDVVRQAKERNLEARLLLWRAVTTL